jgi:hypothetical protein
MTAGPLIADPEKSCRGEPRGKSHRVLVGLHSLVSSGRGNGVSDVSFDLRGVGLVDTGECALTYRRATVHSSLCSASTAPIRRTRLVSVGKRPTNPASPIDLLAYTTSRTPHLDCVRGLNG